MLYTYKPISHDFYKLQTYIEHLVLDVWCKPKGNFSIGKLHSEFQPMVIAEKKLLRTPIQQIYRICNGLEKKHLAKLKMGFKNNNAIKELCTGAKTPMLYDAIAKIDKPLRVKLESFFKLLYKELLKKAAFKNVCGDIKGYYDDFLKTNCAEKCPFCGISDIMSHRLTKRDAFDHYLPKDVYPFNSVNPNNLAPICKTCNTSYKLTQDPINTKTKIGRRAFYPFASKKPKLNIKIKVTGVIKNLKPNEVELKITNSHYKEEIDTWMELFGIKERYVDKICSEDAKFWFDTIIAMGVNRRTNDRVFQSKLELFRNNEIANDNFLKIPYYIACREAGLI
ncbi:MAG: hypothetical protein JST70_12990 [Bacteroidetes bacterium]|nr:hypothetical protein [Bacteroidota bacterium]